MFSEGHEFEPHKGDFSFFALRADNVKVGSSSLTQTTFLFIFCTIKTIMALHGPVAS